MRIIKQLSTRRDSTRRDPSQSSGDPMPFYMAAGEQKQKHKGGGGDDGDGEG